MKLRRRSRRNSSREDPSGIPVWKSRLAAARSLVAECGSAEADASIDGHLALEILGGRDGALDYLYRRWRIYFGATLDQELEEQPADIVACAWKAWAQTTIGQPELARILSGYRDDEVVREADWAHRRMLARLAWCDPASLPGFSPLPAVSRHAHLERKVG